MDGRYWWGRKPRYDGGHLENNLETFMKLQEKFHRRDRMIERASLSRKSEGECIPARITESVDLGDCKTDQNLYEKRNRDCPPH